MRERQDQGRRNDRNGRRQWNEPKVSPTIDRLLCSNCCVIGVSENADHDDADGECDVEASVAFVQVELADDDNGDGGAEDCTVDDRREDPGQVFGDQCLPCEVALYGEGKYECAGGDVECNLRMSAFTDIREYEGSASSENVTFHPVTEGFVGQQTFNQDDKNLLGSHPGNS